MTKKTVIVQEKLNQAAARYSSNEFLRAAVVGIPWVGGSLDAIFGVRGSEIVGRRITALISQLEARFEAAEEEAIRREFIDSDEFAHLIITVFDMAARSRSLERIDRLATYVCGVSTTIIEFDRVEYLLEILNSLTDAEFGLCTVLARLDLSAVASEEQNELQRIGTYWDQLGELTRLQPEHLEDLLVSASGKGVLKEIVGGFFDYTGGKYKTTAAFAELCTLVGVHYHLTQ